MAVDPFTAIQVGLGVGSALSGIFGGGKQKKAAKNVRREIDKQAGLSQERMSSEIAIQKVQEQGVQRANRLQALQAGREARIRRAEILSASINAGISLSSSGTQGALGSVQSQLGQQIGLLNDTQFFTDMIKPHVENIQSLQRQEVESNRQMARQANKAGAIQSNVNMIQSVFGVGQSVAGLFKQSGSGVYDSGIGWGS